MTRRARLSTFVVCVALVLTGLAVSHPLTLRAQPARPNIVLIFPDNLGWGEVGAYGSVRGALTPRIDKLAAEGHSTQQLQRRVLLHGLARGADDRPLRDSHAARRSPAASRCGRSRIAEALKSIGYATALFGKWHLGGDRPEGRASRRSRASTSTYGIPRTSNEAQTTIAQGQNDAGHVVHLGRQGGRAGAERQAVQHGDAPHDRSRIGRPQHRVHGAEACESAKPFFLYYPMTQIHFPTLAHPDFAGKTRRRRHRRRDGRDGRQRRPRARRDRRAGHHAQHHRAVVHRQRRRAAAAVARLAGAVVRLLQQRDGRRHPHAVHHPLAGADSRRPRVQRDRPRDRPVSRRLRLRSGADIVPKDRAIDGVNQLPFLEGKQAESNRDHVLFFTNTQLRAVKWRDWKLHYVFVPEAGAPPVPPLMRLFNLLSDPREETDIKDANPWVVSVDGQARRGVHGDDRALSARAAERAPIRTCRPREQ